MTMRFAPSLKSVETYKEFFDGLDWKKASWPPLDDQEIRAWCTEYLDYPQFTPDRRFVKLLMWRFATKVKPYKSATPGEVAAMVDDWMNLGIGASRARREVANKTGKKPSTVKEHHVKLGAMKGRAGRPKS